MSSKNTTVSLTLLLKGQQAGQEIKRLYDQQVQSTNKINQSWTQIGSAQAKFVNTARAGTQATQNTARAGDQLLRTNRMLEGVLRQQSIQTKIQSQFFKQSASATQQMANFMRQVEQASKRTHQNTQSTMSLWQKGSMIGGAAMASGYVVSSALQKPRDYDQMLTYITGTATAGQGMSTAQRLASKSTLNEYVKGAVRSGGGTRESAAAALNTLIASGEYDLNNVKPALNTAVKTAFATDATAEDAATLTLRMKDFGVKDLGLGHDIAVRGGQLGSFEYKDQAKWLAQQMAAARASGYSGKDGLIRLVAMNQIAKTTAATSDEAGNNVVNLLQKLSSREFSDSIAKSITLESGDPTRRKKKETVFDWSTYSINEREKGVYGVEAFVKLLERQLAGNKQYQALQTKAHSAATPDEKKNILNDMSNIAAGTQIGQIIADRQALMAALAVVYNKDKNNELVGQLQNAGGTVDAESSFVKKNEWAKDIAMNQEKLFAQSKAYDGLSESLGNAKDKIKNWAEKNEGLAATAYTASVALGAVAVAGGAVALLGGGRGIGGMAKGGLGIASKALPFMKGAAVPLTLAAGAYGLYDTATDNTLSTYQRNVKQAGIVGGTGGALAGMATGAAIGSVVPGIGTAIGGLVGGGLGYFLGDKGGEALGKYFNEQHGILDEQNQLIQQQNQYSQQMMGKFDVLIDAVNNNKPVITLGGTTLLDAMAQHASTEEKRHGTSSIPPFLKRL